MVRVSSTGHQVMTFGFYQIMQNLHKHLKGTDSDQTNKLLTELKFQVQCSFKQEAHRP